MIYFFITLLVSLQLLAGNFAGSFEIKPFTAPPSAPVEIEAGLKQLYQGQIEEAQLSELSQKSQDFQSFIFDTLTNRIQTDKDMKYTTEESVMLGNFVKETTVRFDSLFRRNQPHASNEVVAKIYEPAIQKKFCSYQYPTTVLLHHISNDAPSVMENVAKGIASGVLGRPAIVVVLHLPHYGLRKQGDEDFLTADAVKFKENIVQFVLDLHLLKNYLETRNNINQQKISLSGLSLGAVLGLVAGAFEQSFTSYGNFMGGTDMASILMNRARHSPESESGVIFKKAQVDEPQLREAIAAFDATTWLHRYKNKKVLIVSASRDEVINYQISVQPMLKHLQLYNSVQHKLNDDTHSPTGSAVKKLKEVVLPLLNFIVDGSPTSESVCDTNIL